MKKRTTAFGLLLMVFTMVQPAFSVQINLNYTFDDGSFPEEFVHYGDASRVENPFAGMIGMQEVNTTDGMDSMGWEFLQPYPLDTSYPGSISAEASFGQNTSGSVESGLALADNLGNVYGYIGLWNEVGQTETNTFIDVYVGDPDSGPTFYTDIAGGSSENLQISWTGDGTATLSAGTYSYTGLIPDTLVPTVFFWFNDGTGISYIDDLSVQGELASVPEPASLLLIGSGLAGLLGISRKRTK